MTEITDEVQILMDLGLTLVQARVFLSLVKSGKATVNQVAKFSKVTRTDVYRTISALQELSLVEKVIAAPTEFRAVSMQDGIFILLERRNKVNAELQRKAINLLRQNQDKTQLILQEEKAQFVLIPAKEAAMRRKRKALKETRESIDIISSWKMTHQALFNLSEEIQETAKRGVKVRIIQEKPENNKPHETNDLFKNMPTAEFRYVNTCPQALLTLWGKKEVFLTLLPSAEFGESPVFWSNHPSLVSVIQDYFEEKWQNASKNE